MWTDDSTKLSTCIGQTDADTSSHRAVEGSDAFGPDDWVRRTGTGRCDDEADVFDGGVWNSNKQYITYYDGGFNYLELAERARGKLGHLLATAVVQGLIHFLCNM
jgi:hypothetical protein